jgi:hypothetical protein
MNASGEMVGLDDVGELLPLGAVAPQATFSPLISVRCTPP